MGVLLWTWGKKHRTDSGWQKEETRLKIAKTNRSQKKVLYTIFFNSSGIVWQKSREEEKSIIGNYYWECVLAEANRFYNRVRQNICIRGIKFFHEDTGLSFGTLSLFELSNCSWQVFESLLFCVVYAKDNLMSILSCKHKSWLVFVCLFFVFPPP